MSILDKLRFRKKKPQVQESRAAAAVEEKPGKEEMAQKRKGGRDIGIGRAYQILLRPVTSEKGTHLAGQGRYVFAVLRSANKSEIRKGIERVYDVHVRKVRIVSMPAKSRRYGKTQGRTSAWKKAIVQVRSGEKIPGIIESVG